MSESEIVKSINNFGITKLNNQPNINLSNSINTIIYKNQFFVINVTSKNINFVYLSKFFPSQIITYLANKFNILLLNPSTQEPISQNWIIPLNNKLLIGYLLDIYLYEIDNSKHINQAKQSKQAKQTKQTKQIKTKPYKKKKIPIALKRKVWSKWIGEDIGKTKCLCCKLTDITQMNFSCGHIMAESKGGELNVDNLKPICASCNSSMGNQNMEEFIAQYKL